MCDEAGGGYKGCNPHPCIGNFRRVCPIFNRAIGKMKRHTKKFCVDIPPFVILLWRQSENAVFLWPNFPELSFMVFRFLLGMRVKHPESCIHFESPFKSTHKFKRRNYNGD